MRDIERGSFNKSLKEDSGKKSLKLARPRSARPCVLFLFLHLTPFAPQGAEAPGPAHRPGADRGFWGILCTRPIGSPAMRGNEQVSRTPPIFAWGLEVNKGCLSYCGAGPLRRRICGALAPPALFTRAGYRSIGQKPQEA